MGRWIVSNLPAWLVLLGLLVIVAGGAVVAQMILRRRYPALTADVHNDATRFAFSVPPDCGVRSTAKTLRNVIAALTTPVT